MSKIRLILLFFCCKTVKVLLILHFNFICNNINHNNHMGYTVIKSTPEQIEKLWSKHLKPFLGVIPKNFNVEYDYDDEDDIGFVSFNTITGKEVNYQLRGEIPCFVEFTGFGNIRYDIHYPEQEHKEMFLFLQKIGLQARDEFWKGGQI